MGKIKDILFYPFRVLDFIKLEFYEKGNYGLFQFLKNARNGFVSVSPILYDFDKYDKKDYLTEWARIRKTPEINGRQRIVLDDKLLFQMMNRDSEIVPTMVGFTKNNTLYRLIDGELLEIGSKDEFSDFVKEYPKGLIIRPQTGGGGHGVIKVIIENGVLCFQGACQNIHDFFVKFVNSSKNFVITEVIKQDGLLHEIYPKSLNTLRLMTLIDPYTDQPFIACAFQRFGSHKTGFVDNFGSGGISVYVNPETGIMGKGISYSRKDGKQTMSVHPDTGMNFEALQVPSWDKVKAYTLKLAHEYHYLPHIGWDIVPMEDGLHIIEGNSNSGIDGFQVHGPFLKPPRVREFYRYHKVIK